MYRTLLEGVWLSDIGRMAEVRYISFQRNLQLKIHLSSYFSSGFPNFSSGFSDFPSGFPDFLRQIASDPRAQVA